MERKPALLYGLPILSAILLAAAFRDTRLAWLAWCGLPPFFYVLLQPQISWKQGLKAGACFSMVFYLLLLHWFRALYPLDWMGFGPVASFLLLSLAVVLVACIKTFFWLWFGAAMAVCPFKNPWGRACYLACGWLAVEWLQGLVPGTAFTWGRLAASQYQALPLIQSASLFGSLGLSGLMAFINALLALCLLAKGRRRVVSLLLAAGLWCLNLGFGQWQLAQPFAADSTITAAVVQSDYGAVNKHAVDKTAEIFQQYQQLSRQAGPVDLLVWPETAIPELPLAEIQRFADRLDTTILTGAFAEEGQRVENTVFLVEPGRSRKVYVKEHLVPMGEYMPLEPLLGWISPDMISLAAGGPNSPVFWRGHKLGNLICFDSTFSTIARQQAKAGAEVLAVVTNDSWFEGTIAIDQHHGHSVLRAVETGLTVLRAANDGRSSVIDGRGRVVAALQPGKKGYLKEEISLAKSHTIYVQLGDLVLICATILFGTGTILGLANIIRRRRGWHGNQNQTEDRGN